MSPAHLPLRNPSLVFFALLAMLNLAAACAPLRGYPDDPENTNATLVALTPYFDPEYDRIYNEKAPGTERQQLRDLIVMSRIRAYDLEFDDFEKRLNGDANSVTLGGDLILLTLTGLTATIGGVVTKAALGAAATGVAGAQAAINKDLYYQRTLPAMLAQMEANRARAKLAILQGLNLDDSKYPLVHAELDLDALKRAGSIPASIENITQQSVAYKMQLQNRIDQLRSTSFNTTASTSRIVAWLFPNGTKDPAGKPIAPDSIAYAALKAWMDADPDPILHNNTPPWVLATSNDPAMENARQRALSNKTLNIP